MLRVWDILTNCARWTIYLKTTSDYLNQLYTTLLVYRALLLFFFLIFKHNDDTFSPYSRQKYTYIYIYIPMTLAPSQRDPTNCSIIIIRDNTFDIAVLIAITKVFVHRNTCLISSQWLKSICILSQRKNPVWTYNIR